MKLSIAIPSHNTGTRVNASLLNACSLGADDVEVIIQDNSGNEEKGRFLSSIQEKNCHIISTDECIYYDNFMRVLNRARGEFTFLVGDDDFVNSHALPAICERIDLIRNDPSIIGVTGIYIVEDSVQSRIVPFNTLGTPMAMERFRANLEGRLPSVMLYTPFRTEITKQVWNYYFSLPLRLSYHDWILHSLYLMHGKLSYVDRYFYHYDNSNWVSREQCQKTDEHYCRIVGIDPSAIELQWLINAYEGARSFSEKYLAPQMPQDERNQLAVYWFNHWFQNFINGPVRCAADAKFETQTLKLSNKWRAKTLVDMPELLGDITEYYALSSPEIAQKYFDFWK